MKNEQTVVTKARELLALVLSNYDHNLALRDVTRDADQSVKNALTQCVYVGGRTRATVAALHHLIGLSLNRAACAATMDDLITVVASGDCDRQEREIFATELQRRSNGVQNLAACAA